MACRFFLFRSEATKKSSDRSAAAVALDCFPPGLTRGSLAMTRLGTLMRLLPVLRRMRVDPQRDMQPDRGFGRIDHHLGHHLERRLDFVVRGLEHQFVVNL